MLSSYAEGEISADLVGIARRASENNSNRGGMQWKTLIKLAGAATWVLHDNMLRSLDKQGYVISVKDPEPERGNDLTPVYQFVASSHAFDVLGARTSEVQEQRRAAFVANCQIINTWYEVTAPLALLAAIGFLRDGKSIT